ncbi:Transposon Tf2-6 polyprotein [Labeo rohita]|uniref:Gypsy retrotransposon integrase-like protein 1 n=1 Tax=Labeo rohita TaxID=84645 RepID=A0ABQ8L8D8_LABRO|nr:Transposon Tf2-6 polyprotein [Labeo rohita]
MSSSDPFQELVDTVRQAILATLPSPTAPNPPPSPAPSPTVNNASSPLSVVCPMVRTTPFCGAAGDCKGFLLQCSITFATYPHVFNSDSSKIGYLISCLTGTALRWAESIWNQAGPLVRSYTAFTHHFLEVFGRVDQETSAGEELYNFRQCTLSIQEYSVRFRTLAASSGWNERALLTTYRQGLEPNLRMMLAPHDDSMGLEHFIQMTIRCATRISSYSHSSMSTGGASPSPPADHSPPEQPPEPMQVDSRRLTPQERQRRLSMGLCLYCGQSSHQILDCPPHRRFVPPDERIPLIHSSHTSLGTGHPGTNRTLSLLQDRFWWPRMEQDVQRYVRGCRECAMSKSPRHLPSGKLVPLPVPNRPWSHLGVDFITDLPPSEGNTCILVIVDRFSKFCRLIPLQGLPTAWNTAKLLFDQVFRSYGLPEDIVSDRGLQFISRVWKAFFRLLGVTVSLSSGYHPQTNGQTERKIQEVGRFLRTFCTSHQDTWNQFLGWAEYAQNSLRQATTGLTPFQCILGFQPPLFPWTGEPSDVPSVDHWFRESERVWDEAHQHLQRAVRRQVATADRRRSDAPTFQVGNKVWLSTRDIRLRLPCKKLSPRFVGPFTITEQINPVTYRLQLPAHYRIHPTFHVSLLKPHYDSLLSTEPGREEPPPPMITEGTIYTVKEILNSRRRGGRLQYFVDWEGYGPEERSWVSREDILDPTLLTDFHQNHPDRPAPQNRGRPPRRRRGPASGEGPGGGPGGGGNVTSTPGSTLTTTQRSQSPEF